jgi:hypothetical protein
VIGSSAAKLCKFADAKGVVQTDSKLNDQLWVGRKHCKILDLQAAFPGLCWAPLMSRLFNKARFTVCMQPTHKDHQDHATAAHAYPANYSTIIGHLFQV